MTFEYSCTDEFLKAVWSHLRAYTTISASNARVWYVAAPAVCLMLLLLGKYSGYHWLQTQASFFLFGSIVSIPLHIGFDTWKFSKWRRSNFPHGSGGEHYRVIANDEGMILAKQGSFETRLAWHVFTGFLQNESITIMALSPHRPFYFPTRAMTAEQSAELKELVAKHVTGRKP
jgi:hypothetical protein